MFNDNDVYRTSSGPEFVTLNTLGKKFLGVDKVNGSNWFIFDDEKGCREIVNTYYIDDSQVDTKSYYESIERMRKGTSLEKKI